MGPNDERTAAGRVSRKLYETRGASRLSKLGSIGKHYDSGRLSTLSKSTAMLDNLSSATKQAGCPRLSRLSNIFPAPLDANLKSVSSRVCQVSFVVLVVFCLWTSNAFCQAPQELNAAQRAHFENAAVELQKQVDALVAKSPAAGWTDAVMFAKGMAWALKYDREFTNADIQLLQKSVQRTHERITALTKNEQPWLNRRGKVALAYQSVVDGSVQPYGVNVPANYDSAKPTRLDVVLHGSTKPIGMSELRHIARFDEGDVDTGSGVDRPYIELHPLGRVENCYRWAGETDVFEAIEDVCRRYNIDRNRIVLRGMSMGASGTWHLGLKHPDRFAALGPYCGYVDTHKFSETPLPTFVRVGPLPPHQEAGLHMLDSIDYASNASVVPSIACMGEKDIFFQAHVLMAEAMSREGLTMTNLISPGTGHVIDPVTHAEQMRQIAEFVAKGARSPTDLKFVTWTLKYNRCHWLEVLQLNKHYERSELKAKFENDSLLIDEPLNINRFAIVTSKLPKMPTSVRVGGADVPLPKDGIGNRDRIVLVRRFANWGIQAGEESPNSGKRPGVQGPIDDAFTTPFICVRGTGQPWNTQVQKYAERSLQRFAAEWHHYFRGDLPIKDDVAVTDDDIRSKNLILFGDPGSNSLMAKVVSKMPLKWTKDSLQLGGENVAAADHVPALIAPNPLSPDGKRYVVFNSGHTFREAELAKLNYLLFPRWGDWALLKIDDHRLRAEPLDEEVVRAGYFDEQWK